MTARRVLVVGGIGCCLLALLAVGSCVGFVLWVKQPGDVLEPARLLDDGATGYVEWTLRLEDPGTRQFVETGLRRLQDLPREAGSPLPPVIDAWIERRQAEQTDKELPRLFPIVLVWTMHPREGAPADDHLVSASLRGVDHQLVVLDWLAGIFLRRAEDVRVGVHRGERIYTFPSRSGGTGAVAFIRDGDLFVASDEDTARRAVDRLTGEPRAGTAGGDLGTWLARAPSRPLRGAVSNSRGEIGRLWRTLVGEGDPLADGVLGMTLGGEFGEDGAFHAAIDLHFAQEDAVAPAADGVRRGLEHVLAESPIRLTGVEDGGGGVLRLTFDAAVAAGG